MCRSASARELETPRRHPDQLGGPDQARLFAEGREHAAALRATVLVGGAGPPPQALGYGAGGWVPNDAAATLKEAVRVAALPRRRRVLFMEDDPSVRDVIARLGRRAGFACLEAPDGEVGLALARRRPPDVAVIDKMMPGLDGLAVIREMRRDPALARVPVVLATGQIDRSTRKRAAAVGVEVLIKPVDAAELLQALERALTAGVVLSAERDPPAS